jgi:hypothetical protein
MIRLAFIGGLLASCVAVSTEAATVLNFDATRGPGGDTGYIYGDYQEKGFILTPDECTDTNTCFVTSGSFANSLDKTGAALATQINPATVTVLKDDGAAFRLNAIDIADFYGNFYGLAQPTDTIRFTFSFADGTSSLVSYSIANTSGQWVTPNTLTFDLAPLTAFSFLPLNGSQIQFDNVTLSDGAAAVPEAATWAMMVAGFGLTGAKLRRRRQIAALA